MQNDMDGVPAAVLMVLNLERPWTFLVLHTGWDCYALESAYMVKLEL